jgi:membrane protein implicated in regulation of membrane protease activity
MDNNSINSINKILNDKYGAADEVNKMYKDLSYFDQYGGSVFLFILLILIMFVVLSYSMVMKNIQPIKDNWAKERCKANVIPFAGLINAPDGTSATDFTQQNFTYCMQDILKSVTGFATQPLTYLTYTINLVYQEIAKALNAIRSLLSNIRNNLGSITQEIMGRILNVTVPIRKMLIAFNDMGQKVIGILTSGLYTSLGTYYALKAFLGALVQIIIIILVASVAIIIGLWLSFAWPAAIAGTVLFVTVVIICAIVIAFLKNVLHVKSGFKIPKAPKKPKICFDKDTMLKMVDGSVKKISEINVGDKLWNYSDNGNKVIFVTAKLKLNAKHTKMYRLGNVVVSGTHRVKHNGKWIFASKHPDRIVIQKYTEPVIYCLNTSSKEIIIDDYVFSDWDEVTEEVHDIINEFVRYHYPNKKLEKEEIHQFFDRGFSEYTMLRLSDGSLKSIKFIELGDVLKNGEKVYGVVEIYGKNEIDEPEKTRNTSVSSDSSNSYLENDELMSSRSRSRSRSRSSLDSIQNTDFSKDSKLYHLLTDKKSFYVGQIFMKDYNSLIDHVLEKTKLWNNNKSLI